MSESLQMAERNPQRSCAKRSSCWEKGSPFSLLGAADGLSACEPAAAQRKSADPSSSSCLLYVGGLGAEVCACPRELRHHQHGGVQ
jgi:hypothetical protein